jgi:hypothetical protein
MQRRWGRFATRSRPGNNFLDPAKFLDPRQLASTVYNVANTVLNSIEKPARRNAAFNNVTASQTRPSKPVQVAGDTSRSPCKSYFWEPHHPESPFSLGREEFLRRRLHVDSSSIVRDDDIEAYVDSFLSRAVLRSSQAMPASLQKTIYVSVVRCVLHVILRMCDNVEEATVLGKQLLLVKEGSENSRLRGSPASLDPRVVHILAERVLADHKKMSLSLALGVPERAVLALYEDIIALTTRLAMDVMLSADLRCLGHSVRVSVTMDDMLHTAPGWNVALDEGAFGHFDDKEKRKWAAAFAEDVLSDPKVRIAELPIRLQTEMASHVAVILVHLAETAFNHCRLHIAGVALRPALALSARGGA